MDSVPFVFVEALCATLRERDLKNLQQIGTPWTWTATTQYDRTRELVVRISAEGTEVETRIFKFVNPESVVDLASLSKYDRIVDIQVKPVRRVRAFYYADPFDPMPLDEFRTDVLPLLKPLAAHYPFDIAATGFDMDARRYPEQLTDLLFSSLRGPAQNIDTGFLGERCVEFIERQIALGYLEQLQLHGQEWPESMVPSLLAFLKSPSFKSLDISEANHLERVETKVLPLPPSLADDYAFSINISERYPQHLMHGIFSGLCAPARFIHCKNAGVECVQFIEKQITLGQLGELRLRGNEWHESMKTSLLEFLKAPNFRSLDISETNLTIDLDMLTCVVERFLKGGCHEYIYLYAKPSEEIEEIRTAIRFDYILPPLDGLPEHSVSIDKKRCAMVWTGPGPERLYAAFSDVNLQIFLIM
uniref:F-box domain-containing protein n=1 Tax=Steinernema glaseri TaxID=37863 RepID=A0A1I8ARX3_9BILA